MDQLAVFQFDRQGKDIHLLHKTVLLTELDPNCIQCDTIRYIRLHSFDRQPMSTVVVWCKIRLGVVQLGFERPSGKSTNVYIYSQSGNRIFRSNKLQRRTISGTHFELLQKLYA